MTFSEQLAEASAFSKKCRPGSPVATPDDLEAHGNCYEDALTAMLLPVPRKGWVLVHGRPTLQRKPFTEYGHAWLEQGDQVWDPSTGFRATREVYYKLGKIDYRHNLVYTPEEARRFVLYYMHYGSWEGVDGTSPMSKGHGKKPKRSLKSKPVKGSSR